jgi:hypothetical protein
MTLKQTDPVGRFRDRLSLPLMFPVSGVDPVAAACRDGVIGSFPTVNCSSPGQLGGWLGDIEDRLRRHCDETGACPTLHGVVFVILCRALRCTAEEALRRVRETRSLLLRAYWRIDSTPTRHALAQRN